MPGPPGTRFVHKMEDVLDRYAQGNRILIWAVSVMGRMECIIPSRSLPHGRLHSRAPGFPVHRSRGPASAPGPTACPGDILLIATLAVICGADSWTEVELFGRQKQAWPTTFLALPHGIPSHDTFGRVFARLDPAQPGSALRAGYSRWRRAFGTRSCRWTARWPAAPATPSGGPPLHLVSAWADEARLVLGQCRVADKSNEITAMSALLEGGIVTIDAMGCYTRIAQTLRDRGADYVLALKDNQPQWHEARWSRPSPSSRRKPSRAASTTFTKP